MSTLKLNGKSLASQTSSDEPVIASTVTGSPAIALTNATGTMPNGTQDNITRLGTVASGTLASSVTFPSGHILQCKGDRYDFKTEGSAINVTNSTTTPFGVGLEVAITCASTSNFLRLDTCVPDIYTASCSGGFHAGFVYDTSSFASSFTGLPGTAGSHANGQYVALPYNLYGGNAGSSIYPFSMMVYCPVPTTSAIKIRVYLRSNAAETYQIGGNFAPYSCHSSITVMEIQA